MKQRDYEMWWETSRRDRFPSDPSFARHVQPRHLTTTATNITPAELAAQCKAIDGRRLPVRARSSEKSTPAALVKATVPPMRNSVANVLPPAAASSAAFAAPPPEADNRCHNPKRTADPHKARRRLNCRVNSPHNTPRNANSSIRTVLNGMMTATLSHGFKEFDGRGFTNSRAQGVSRATPNAAEAIARIHQDQRKPRAEVPRPRPRSSRVSRAHRAIPSRAAMRHPATTNPDPGASNWTVAFAAANASTTAASGRELRIDRPRPSAAISTGTRSTSWACTGGGIVEPAVFVLSGTEVFPRR